jgi:hypothetical protein
MAWVFQGLLKHFNRFNAMAGDFSELVNFLRDQTLGLETASESQDTESLRASLSYEKTREISKFLEILYTHQTPSDIDQLPKSCIELLLLLQDKEIQNKSEEIAGLADQDIKESGSLSENTIALANSLHADMESGYPSATAMIVENFTRVFRDPKELPDDALECGVAVLVCAAINVVVSANVVVVSHAAAAVVAVAFVIGGSHPVGRNDMFSGGDR